MPKHATPSTITTGAAEPGEPLPEAGAEALAQLRGDCARMAPHWSATVTPAPSPVPPSRIRGVSVPDRSAHLLDGMSDYGD